MAGDESFDPRSWGQGSASSAAPRSDLPEAWRDVAQSTAPPPPPAPTEPKPARNIGPLLPFMASFALLASGGIAAWAMRSPPVTETFVETAEAPPVAAQQSQLTSRSLVLASAKDLTGALTAAGLSPQEAGAANAAAMQVLGSAQGEIRAVLDLLAAPGGLRLERLQASFADGSGAVVTRGADGQFTTSRVAAQLSSQIKVVSGELDSDSFYSSAVAAGINDALIPEFVNAFSFDFNLAAEVSPGDTFEVAYEQTVNAEGQPIGPAQLLYAQLVTATKRKALYRFKPTDQEVGWFDGNGASTVRSFMRTPVDGARITSKFGPRFHPVLHYTRLHAGVDFGVPIGTPVYAAADGTVVGSTPTGCGGNMAVVQHDNGWVTRYFHLSKFADGLHNGQRVTQGFTVGLSGTTGTCTTGPHLHYEVRIGGEPVDPMSIKTEGGRKGLEGAALAAFIQQRDRVDVARAQQAQ